ncbi:hypothetical protein EU534_02285 [Candidatus Heimdallarchaeota archaeon]|nr:MAG: hypothetical protein EU534_02285 [Candidatus Heimdallarchaeota archaeon]
MFEETKNQTENESSNPINEEMIEDIEHLIETYIPPFMDRYEDKLRDIVLYESDNITSKEDLKRRIIKKLGIVSLEDPLFKFIMHSVKPKIQPLLPLEPTSKQEALDQVKATVSKLVEEAVKKINSHIEELLTPEKEQVEKEQINLDELDDDALIEEVLGDYVEIIDDISEEEEEEEQEIEDQIEEYPAVVTGLVDIPTEEPLESKATDFDRIKEILVERMLKKHSHRIEARFPDLIDQNKAKEIFRKRIESVIEETLAKRKKQ